MLKKAIVETQEINMGHARTDKTIVDEILQLMDERRKQKNKSEKYNKLNRAVRGACRKEFRSDG